jgi:tRNA(fMet)-specific endonuclease VapC
MGVILDSSLLIAAERQRFDLRAFHFAHATETFHLAAITASELLHGVERASELKTKNRRSQFVEDVLSDFVVIAFSLPEAREHARLWAALEARGQMIGPHDLEIAATAQAHGFSVATLNMDEFQRVPGLNLLAVKAYALG